MSIYRDYAKQIKNVMVSSNVNESKMNEILEDMVTSIGYKDMIYLVENMVMADLDSDVRQNWKSYFTDKINLWKENINYIPMKRFVIEFKEVSYGVVEVYAENEDEARAIADSEGLRYVAKSEMTLGSVQNKEEIKD